VALIALFACAISYALRLNFARPAHDIPADVKHSSPSSARRRPARTPGTPSLASLIDTDSPCVAPSSILARPTKPIRGGIKVCSPANIDVYEDGAVLEKPRIVAALCRCRRTDPLRRSKEARAHVWARLSSDSRPLSGASNSSGVCLNVQSARPLGVRHRPGVDRLGGAVTTRCVHAARR